MSALKETAQAAIEDANARRRDRRNNAARLAAETRANRHEHAVSRVATQMIGGRELGPRSRCAVCGRVLEDRVSIKRGVGPECLGDVRRAVEATHVPRQIPDQRPLAREIAKTGPPG